MIKRRKQRTNSSVKGITIGGVLFLGTPHKEEDYTKASPSTYSNILSKLLGKRDYVISERILQPIRDMNRNYWKSYGGDTVLNESIGPTDESGVEQEGKEGKRHTEKGEAEIFLFLADSSKTD